MFGQSEARSDNRLMKVGGRIMGVVLLADRAGFFSPDTYLELGGVSDN